MAKRGSAHVSDPEPESEPAAKSELEPAAKSELAPADTVGEWWAGRPLPRGVHLLLGLALPALVAAAQMWRLRAHTVDDAFISYRYAQNLARGWGLVYNQGERIEGYTNFLWTVLLAACVKLGLDPVVMAKVLGAACALGTLVLLYRLEERLRPFASVPCLSTWLLATTTVFQGYAVFGLETSLFALLVVAGTYLFWAESHVAGRFPWSGLVFAAAGLTRPEAPMYLGLAMLFLGGKALLPWRPPRWADEEARPDRLLAGVMIGVVAAGTYKLWRPLSIPVQGAALGALVLAALLIAASIPRALVSRQNLLRGALFVLPVAAHLAWRRSFYGRWLPNTLLAKTGDLEQQLGGGVQYLSNYLTHEGPVIYLALFGVAAALAWKHRELCSASAVVVCGAAYVVLVGGDWMMLFRFVAPLQPFLFLLIGVAARVLVEKRSRVANYGLALLALVTLAQRSTKLEADRRFVFEHEKAFWDSAAGGTARWFREEITRRGRDDVYGAIALGDIGEIGYRTDFPILDLLGLVDPVVAALPGGYTHKIGPRFNDHFFEQKPRYFVLISAQHDCHHPSVIGSRVIYGDPRFAKSYQVSGRVMWKDGFRWCIYEHRDQRQPDRQVNDIDNRPRWLRGR